MPIAADLLVSRISELLTFSDDGAGLVHDAAFAARQGKVVWVGGSNEAPAAVALEPGGESLDADGQVVLPGLVDCHSHFIFGGDRSGEFAARCAGATYLQLAAAGGGIRATVTATASAADDWLVRTGVGRAARLLAQGVTTSEAKSGYGLSTSAELRLLRVIGEVAKATPLEIHPTLLGLHALPPAADRERFVDAVIDELIPEAAERNLASQFDAFLEEGAFTAAEVERAFRAAKRGGLALRLHADQLTNQGGAELAARCEARSADHLEQISRSGIEALATTQTVAVLAPLATLALRLPRPAPAVALRDAGVTLALCTNWNPGSAPSENVWLTVSLACLTYGLLPWEALRAFAVGGARVLGQQLRLGRLLPGYDADFAVYGCSDHRHLASHAGINHARAVYKAGQRVVTGVGVGGGRCPDAA